jgi:hypothetical protein
MLPAATSRTQEATTDLSDLDGGEHFRSSPSVIKVVIAKIDASSDPRFFLDAGLYRVSPIAAKHTVD